MSSNSDIERFQMANKKIPFKYTRPVEDGPHEKASWQCPGDPEPAPHSFIRKPDESVAWYAAENRERRYESSAFGTYTTWIFSHGTPLCWSPPSGRQLTIFNTQATISIGGNDRKRPYQGQLSGLYYNGLKVLNMAAEGHPNIKVNGSVRLVGDVPTSRSPSRTTTSMPPEMSTTFIETTTTLSTTTTRKQRSPPTIQNSPRGASSRRDTQSPVTVTGLFIWSRPDRGLLFHWIQTKSRDESIFRRFVGTGFVSWSPPSLPEARVLGLGRCRSLFHAQGCILHRISSSVSQSKPALPAPRRSGTRRSRGGLLLHFTFSLCGRNGKSDIDVPRFEAGLADIQKLADGRCLRQTTDDIVSSAECSSDDEDLEECDGGHTGGIGVALELALVSHSPLLEFSLSKHHPMRAQCNPTQPRALLGERRLLQWTQTVSQFPLLFGFVSCYRSDAFSSEISDVKPTDCNRNVSFFPFVPLFP
ncbi:hypothetical protein DNTS_018602 [Danionella cerebrum]|uniref:Uncharacterized protein n=1 Tax=Danionella cerebrum TaxID=2873325 RepID=A0A553Q9M8_9TELE|nr:hypothetical protein DNTS_018602 [Danionella translucida]